MSDSIFVLKTDFDMVTYELRDKTEFLAQNIMRLILDVDLLKREMSEVKRILVDHTRILAEHTQELKVIKADINKMDAKLDLIIEHLKI